MKTWLWLSVVTLATGSFAPSARADAKDRAIPRTAVTTTPITPQTGADAAARARKVYRSAGAPIARATEDAMAPNAGNDAIHYDGKTTFVSRRASSFRTTDLSDDGRSASSMTMVNVKLANGRQLHESLDRDSSKLPFGLRFEGNGRARRIYTPTGKTHGTGADRLYEVREEVPKLESHYVLRAGKRTLLRIPLMSLTGKLAPKTTWMHKDKYGNFTSIDTD